MSKSLKFVLVGTVASACIVSAALFGTSSSLNSSVNFLGSQSTETEQAFIQFVARYGKTYATKSELPRRFEIFSRNYEMVKKHNSKEGALFEMGINQFSDLERHEIVGQGLHLSPEDLSEAIDSSKIRLMADPPRESVDWRTTNKLNPVDNHGIACNSQWAFNSRTMMESAASLLQNEPASQNKISVQQLIDCDTTNQGCGGGWPARNFKWVANKGYIAQSRYPSQYIGVRRQCQLLPAGDIQRFSYLRSRQYLMIYPEMLKQFVGAQPVGVGISTPECVLNYKSGILNQAECDCSSEKYEDVNVDATFIVVGYGATQEKDKEYLLCSGYWILRSTWGESWGDQGHIKLCINRGRDLDNIGTCNVLVYPHLPDVGMLPPL